MNREQTKIKISGDYLIVIKQSASRFTKYLAKDSPTRGMCLSASSQVRLRTYLRESETQYKAFATLTYPNIDLTPSLVKIHIDSFGKRYSRYVAKLPITPGKMANQASLLWVLEFTKAGQPHIHMALSHRLPKEMLSLWWYEIVGTEDVRHLQAGTNIKSIRGGNKGIGKYLSKYLSKGADSVGVRYGVISWGRFWGVIGSRATMSAGFVYKPEIMDEKQKQLIDKLRKALMYDVKVGAVKEIKLKHDYCRMYEFKSKWSKFKYYALVKSFGDYFDMMREDYMIDILCSDTEMASLDRRDYAAEVCDLMAYKFRKAG